MTGQARYTGDHYPAGMLHVACLASPVPHALIRGDRHVGRRRSCRACSPSSPGPTSGTSASAGQLRDLPVLATDRVRFIGQRVAAVAAETREAAEEAVRLIDVDYEDLPAVFDPREALEPPTRRCCTRTAAGYLTMRGGGPRTLPDAPEPAGRPGRRRAARRRWPRRSPPPTGCSSTPSAPRGSTRATSSRTAPSSGSRTTSATSSPPTRRRSPCGPTWPRPPGTRPSRSSSTTGSSGATSAARASPSTSSSASTWPGPPGRPVRSVMSYVEELSGAGPRHAAEITLRTAVRRRRHLPRPLRRRRLRRRRLRGRARPRRTWCRTAGWTPCPRTPSRRPGTGCGPSTRTRCPAGTCGRPARSRPSSPVRRTST